MHDQQGFGSGDNLAFGMAIFFTCCFRECIQCLKL